MLPLDDVPGCLREAIPTLSRSALHRRLQRYGISHLPQGDEGASRRKRFVETAIGYVHIAVCELRLAQGKLFMLLAIDRATKFVGWNGRGALGSCRSALVPAFFVLLRFALPLYM